MSMVIANNMSAVNTKRQFAISGRGQSSAMEKLSSGYKINTGKDDPSGLVISEKLRSQLNGLKRAQQNTEEAINVMGIAEGALNEMNAILKKMKALAIHSNNTGVTSPDQIAADQAEMDSAIQTLDRIAQTTKFSEDNLLNGAKDIAYDTTTSVKGTQQNSLLNARETSFKQIFKRDDYAVAFSFTGTANADEVTGLGEVDFTKQAAKAYLEVDTSSDPNNQAQISQGKFTQDQQFTLTGTKGSRAFTFNKGETVATMVSQIKSVADSTGIDAALVFNSDQRIHMTANGSITAPKTEATFEIDGLNTNAVDTPVKFTLTGSDALTEALGGKSLTFKVTQQGANAYTLIANDGTKDITLTQGWTGAGNNLGIAIANQINNAAAADVPLLSALSTQLTAAGTIDSASSTFSTTNTYDDSAIKNTTTEIAAGIFAGKGGVGDGNIEMTVPADMDWEAMYNRLNAVDKANFDAAVAASAGFEIKAIFGGNQAAPTMTLELLRADTSTVVSTQTFGLNIDAEAMAEDGFDDITVDVGLFKGIEFTINDSNKDGFGFDDSKVIVGSVGTAAAIAVDVANFNAGKVTKFGKSDSATLTNANIVTAEGADTMDSTALEITFGALKSGAPAVATQIKIAAASDAAATDFLAAIGSEDVVFNMVLDGGKAPAGADETAETFSFTATVGNTTYTLARGITETNAGGGLGAYLATAANKLTAAQVQASAGSDADIDTATALAGLVFSAGTQDAFDLAVSTGLTADDIYDMKVDNVTTTADITVVNDIYNYAGAAAGNTGKIEVRFEDFDLTKLEAVSSGAVDVEALAAAIKGGTAQLSGEIVARAGGDWELKINMLDTNGNKLLQLGSLERRDVLDAEDLTDNALDVDGQTQSADDGWVTLGIGTGFEGLKIRISNDELKSSLGYQGTGNFEATSNATTADALAVSAGGAVSEVSDAVTVGGGASTKTQTGGISADSATDAARTEGNVAIFNNVTVKDKNGVTTGVVEKGITGIEFMVNDNGTPNDTSDDIATGANSIQLGKNTDGQGRIFVKFTDDGSFELYKDSSMSAESLVATGINGGEITQSNNSGLEGIKINITGNELTKVNGVYFTLAGIEGMSENMDYSQTPPVGTGENGVIVNGDVVGEVGTSALFDQDKMLITGVELGKNTDADGRIYLETVYDDKNGTVRVNAYKDRNKTPEDLVAQSDIMSIKDFENATAGSATFVLNEKRNADNTAGTGLGIVLSTGDVTNFANLIKDGQNVTLDSVVEFKNLGARIFAQDYGSANYIKATQDKGNIFSYYAAAGDNESKRMIDATGGGVTVQVNGQDATLSVNGTQVKTNGLELSMATQDIQADLVFNEGKVGSTTLAQVGYDTASIFTKIGALNLGSVDAETEGKYEGLSGLMANAGHVTNERVDNFQGGMQLQLGEGAGDQNRTVVAIKSLTSENLGRVTQGGYWEGNAVYSEKTFTMKDVFGGGAASLKQSPTLAMAIIEQSIADVSELRAQIGAVQSNMLQTNSNNLAVTMENIQKTESGIRDADMADEMTEFTKNQVLQSAAMSMMSQANQSSQNVLQLLR